MGSDLQSHGARSRIVALIEQRSHPVSRDLRTLAIARLVGFLAAVIAIDGPLPRDVHLVMLLMALTAGVALLLAARWSPSAQTRGSAFHGAMLLDLAVLTLLLHLTGGTTSPLLPLAVGWVALGVLTYAGRAAAAYTLGVIGTVAIQPAFDQAVGTHPPVTAEHALLQVTLLLAVGVALSVEVAARQVDQHRRDLRAEANRDALTGVRNRRAFDRRLDELIADRRVGPVSVALLDLDRFKDLNDTHGHLAGDAALAAFAATLVAHLREDDEVFRIGGEEFAIVAPGVDADEACALLRRVRAAAGEVEVDGRPLPTFSAGVVDGDLRDAVDRADRLLYEAKRTGRDRAVCTTSPTA